MGDTRATTTPALSFNHPYGSTARQLSYLDNDGKILTGTDRDGDQWQITVHGPGVVIVNDVTPNDGALDDDIDTIQIVGSDPSKTVVTGNVVASSRVITDGNVRFQTLTAVNGVYSINLNGFNLARTQTVDANSTEPATPGSIYLPGGVHLLSFNNIEAPIDLAADDQPFEIVIGRADSPLTVKPTIKLGSIFNQVYDSTETVQAAGTPPTTPTVSIIVNGEIRQLTMVSATGYAMDSTGYEYAYPVTGTTGRTAVRATAINSMTVTGSLRNTTISRSAKPFSSGKSGLTRLGKLAVGGVTDGLGVDVSQGNIRNLILARGLGDTTGALGGDTTKGASKAAFGNSAYGLYGALIVAQRIGHLTAAPSHYYQQVTQDPTYRQEDTTNWTKYYTRAGRALINTAIVTDGSIGSVNVVGDAQASEIKSGTNYQTYIQGLESERAASRIGPVRWKGNLVDSVVAATYRTSTDFKYNATNLATGSGVDTPGPGRIFGKLVHGYVYQNGQSTILKNVGSGFYARRKNGYLPTWQTVKSQRSQSVNVDL